MTHPSWEIKNLKKRIRKVRNFPVNTCPASRHVQIMGECLTKKGGYPMLTEEPEHCAQSILATVAALYEKRTEAARLLDEVNRLKQNYAKSCVLLVSLGIPSFGTLDQGIRKLAKKVRAASTRAESK